MRRTEYLTGNVHLQGSRYADLVRPATSHYRTWFEYFIQLQTINRYCGLYSCEPLLNFTQRVDS